MTTPSSTGSTPATASPTPAVELDGRVVLVTGAARGQGRAISERVVAAGGRVIAGDVLPDVHELADARPDAVHAVSLDVTDAAAWAQAVQGGLDRFGRLDGLVNNAGVLRRESLERENPADFERVWRINCLGPFLGLQAVAPHLRAAGAGAIVNTVSAAAATAWTLHSAYSSSKWALRGLTKVAALELAPYGIRVNAVLPGPVLTPMVIGDGDPVAEKRLAATPLGRAGLPTDIAELVVFLLSDRAAFIAGAEIAIDGGQTAGVVLTLPDQQ
ncbi:SDR family oxidoreductase [Frankia sp. AgPm24]|uniref:SDR family NAD(P)-dependent oxidoreductase n=1 Tax=Frankia sp. AgPm24 TaxID=631128 RepID=UPI00200F5F64|nr:SDR family NAD(P)-dependent oxidoreductase [Frankia sp. AgPm24]MCK9923731.1 SDR family oxidoreductase [Frankia sp. AgPm24]